MWLIGSVLKHCNVLKYYNQYCSYAKGTTPFLKGANVVTVLNDIENKASKIFDLFSKNYLKANPHKSNLLLASKEETSVKIEGFIIKCNTSKKLLDVIIYK